MPNKRRISSFGQFSSIFFSVLFPFCFRQLSSPHPSPHRIESRRYHKYFRCFSPFRAVASLPNIICSHNQLTVCRMWKKSMRCCAISFDVKPFLSEEKWSPSVYGFLYAVRWACTSCAHPQLNDFEPSNKLNLSKSKTSSPRRMPMRVCSAYKL